MIAPWGYSEARLTARYHVQVEFGGVHGGITTPAHVPVRGVVRRIFRGDGHLHLGDGIQFTVAVCRLRDNVISNGENWLPLSSIVGASFMEVFLNGDPPNCEVACYQYRVINELSESARLRVPTPEEVAAEKCNLGAEV